MPNPVPTPGPSENAPSAPKEELRSAELEAAKLEYEAKRKAVLDEMRKARQAEAVDDEAAENLLG